MYTKYLQTTRQAMRVGFMEGAQSTPPRRLFHKHETTCAPADLLYAHGTHPLTTTYSCSIYMTNRSLSREIHGKAHLLGLTNLHQDHRHQAFLCPWFKSRVTTSSTRCLRLQLPVRMPTS
jgi:hypothetical protein